MKIQTWLKKTAAQLAQAGIDTAVLDSQIILQSTLGTARSWVITHDETELTTDQIAILNKKVVQRINHTPVAYITGSKEFYGRDFTVTKDVLIPRPESESIINILLKLDGLSAPAILDIGTGSGALAVTAQLELPGATVAATDLSKDALAIAKKNALRLKAPIQLYQADLLDIPAGVKPDVILANLPYVPDTLVTSDEIKQEPSMALFSGKDGLSHYKVFWGQLLNLPKKPAHIITESLEGQHLQMTQLAAAVGYRLVGTEVLVQHFIRTS